MPQDHVEELLLGFFQRSPFRKGSLDSQLYVDLNLYLPEDILVKVDRMSMAVSLEVRVPFLDHELVEFAARIPEELKIRRFTQKYILKKSMRHILPPAILKRGKEGFSIPMKNWFRKEFKPLLLDVLSRDRISREGFFDPSSIELLKKEHLEGVQNHSHLLWTLVVFGLWLDRYFRK